MIEIPAAPEIERFAVHVAESDLADLRARLDRVRLPESETVPDASQGIELRRLTALLDAWRRHDWRATEARWNAIPHYRVSLDGLGIALWHARSPEPDALPLLLTHGWPSSALEFEDVLGPLSDPVAHGGSARDAFHVIVPALPGFGFSDRPAEPGWHPGRTARAWADLMTVLGYPRFAAHGGDWGAYVSTEPARLAPERVVGLHLTTPRATPGVSVAQQLETIALYWLTSTGASTARWYWEALRWVPCSAEEENAQPVTVPTFCSLFPADPWPAARRWALRRYRDLRTWNVLDRGGHFPGLEQPALLVSEIRDAFREVRDRRIA